MVADEREVQIQAGQAALTGNLSVPSGATGIVLFAHGSGSSRHSSRNVFVARVLQSAGIGTLLFDLLTRAEEEVDVTRASTVSISGFLPSDSLMRRNGSMVRARCVRPASVISERAPAAPRLSSPQRSLKIA